MCIIGCGKCVIIDEIICVEVIVGGVDILFIYLVGGVLFFLMSVDGVGFVLLVMENIGMVLVVIYFLGLGDVVDIGVVGKVCVIDCGSVLFYDKVNNCELLGGIGVVIVNNELGMFYGILGDINNIFIFVVGVVFEDRSVLVVVFIIDIFIGVSDYGYMSGILMVILVVVGIVVLVWLNYFICIGEEIWSVFKVIVMDVGVVGKDDFFGYGIV